MRKFHEKMRILRKNNTKISRKKAENIREKKENFVKKTPGFLIGWVIVMGEGMGTDRNFKR